MSKKLQCEECGKTEYGEDLYNYDGKILCRYCIVARVCEGITPCEYVGTCNDKAYLNKADQIAKLEQIIKKGNQKLEDYYNQKVDELDEDYNKDLEERVGEILNLEKQLEEEKKLHSLAKSFYDEKQAEFDKLLYDYNQLKNQLAEKDKTQKELAIQQLEKVAELILKIDNNKTEIKTLKNGYSTLYVDSPTVISIIDQQIKKLKGVRELSQEESLKQILEDIKEFVYKKIATYGMCDYGYFYLDDLVKEIDTKILKLKGVKKDGKEN